MSQFLHLLARHLQGVCQLSDEQSAALEDHYELLVRWNRRMNLTSVEDPEELVVFHYGESLFLACQLPPGACSVADIGSGPGFPGVPVGVQRPDCRVTLVESNSRKCVFLREATRNFSNMTVEEGRVESLAGHYDWVVSRAVNWEALVPEIKRLGRSVALLLGESDAGRLRSEKGVAWRKTVKIPWGKHRVLLIGDVPRETA